MLNIHVTFYFVISLTASAIGLILNTYFKEWPMEVAGITEALFPGLAGNYWTSYDYLFMTDSQLYNESLRWLVHNAYGRI